MEELNKYPKSNPFRVPDGYFDNFEEKLSEKINQSTYEKGNIWKINSIKPYLAIAAGFLLIFSLWFMFLNKIDTKEITSYETVIEQDLILSYFESVNSDELIQILTSDAFQNQDFAINSEQDIELVIDDLDESMIIEELKILDEM